MPTAPKISLPILLLLVFAFALTTVAAQQPEAPQESFVKSHYTKYELGIPMRDGKRLFTAVYVPKLGAFPTDAGPYPIMMDRTP